MRNFEVLQPISFGSEQDALTPGSVATLDAKTAAPLVAAGAIKPIPVLADPPIVDPVVPGDQAAALPEVSDKMTVAALTAIAVDEGVTIGDGFTKAEIIAAIALKRAADNAGPREEALE